MHGHVNVTFHIILPILGNGQYSSFPTDYHILV